MLGYSVVSRWKAQFPVLPLEALMPPVSGLCFLPVDSVFSGVIIAEVVPRRSNRPSVAAMSPKQCAAPKKYP